MEACVEAQRALLERSNLLKAKCHVVHRDLYEKPILGVLLEFELIEEGLGLLQE